MNRQRKLGTVLLTGCLALGLASLALASDDYDRLKKDIRVMIGIIKSAFDTDEECPRCRVSIDGHYLADQGIVFNISPHSTRSSMFAFSTDNDFEFHANGIVAALPDVVTDIFSDVEISIDNGEYATIINDANWSEVSEEVREQLREARIQMRELDREMRELKIESLHAVDEELQEIEARERELETQMRELSEHKDSLSDNVSMMVKKRKEERDARIAKREARRLEQFGKMEKIVLDTFCDYSQTMRNLPRGERVSIILKQDKGESKIYVMQKADVDNCDSETTDLRQHALSYAF